MSKWQKVYSDESEYRSEIVKAVLEEHGITTVLMNKKNTVYNNFGQYEVHVSPDFIIKAMRIIKNDINFK